MSTAVLITLRLLIVSMILLPCVLLAAAESGVRFDDTLVDAADQGNLKAVTSLVKSGKFVDSRGKFESTALMRAAFQQKNDVVRFLLSSGANPNLRDIGGATALHAAARRGNLVAAQALIAHDADVNVQDKEGWTPLMRAALEGHKDVIAALVSARADVNRVNMMKESALQHAAFIGDDASVYLLLAHGADVRQRDENGLTAADIAFQRGFDKVQQQLANPPALAALTKEEASASVPEKPAPALAPLPLTTNTNSSSSDEATSATRRKNAAYGSAFDADSKENRHEKPPSDLKTPPLLSTATPTAKKDLPPVLAGAEEGARTLADYTAEGEIRPRGFSFKPLPALEEAAAAPSSVANETPPPAPPPVNMPEKNTSAHAPSGPNFLLQLGTFSSAREAKEHWNALVASQADKLGGRELVVSEVLLRTNNRTVYRTQAGYYPSRYEADVACNQLAERKIDCFVVESAPKGSSTMLAEQSLPAAPIAALAQPAQASATAPLPIPKPAINTLAETKNELPKELPPSSENVKETVEEKPWRAIESEAASSPAPSTVLPAAKTNTQNIDTPPVPAAPAPTPLVVDMSTLPSRSTFAADAPSALANTTPENKPVQTKATHAPTSHTPPSYAPDGGKIRNLAEKAPSSAKADNEKPKAPALEPRPEPAYLPSRDSHQSTQWAQVGYFGNEFAAQEFWEALATDHPEITSVLRLRISQPFQMREKGGVTARIGPITSADQREKICDLARYRRLQCAKFSDKGSASSSIMERGRASEPASEINENASAIGFWVQLGSYGDTAQAEQQWRALVSAHPDVLKKQSYDISAPHYSSSNARVLRLRAGPFAAQDQAMELCGTLQKRGVRCLTLRN